MQRSMPLDRARLALVGVSLKKAYVHVRPDFEQNSSHPTGVLRRFSVEANFLLKRPSAIRRDKTPDRRYGCEPHGHVRVFLKAFTWLSLPGEQFCTAVRLP